MAATVKELLECPECGRKGLKGPAALGLHRRRAHGIVGQRHVQPGGTNGTGVEATGTETTSGSPKRSTARRAAPKRGSAKRSTAGRKRQTGVRRVSGMSGTRARRSNVSAPNATPPAVMEYPADKLLKSIFPSGIPATRAAMERVQAWLAEGEALFKTNRNGSQQ